jgi:hypothetical protein
LAICGQRKLFHVPRMFTITTTAMICLLSGRTMFQYCAKWPAPSRRADSNSSCGKPSKNPLNRKIAMICPPAT